jgi:hypothetical protein
MEVREHRNIAARAHKQAERASVGAAGSGKSGAMDRRMLVGLTLVTAMLFGAGRDVSAARFVTSLSSVKVTARPGQVLTREHKLTLDKQERATRFKFRVEDWWRSEDGQQSFYAVPGTLKHSCGNWVNVNPVEAVVEPGATLTARLTISVPRELAAGGYWCVLTVDESPNPLDAPSGVGAQFMASVSTGIFIYIDPVERAVDFADVHVGESEAFVKLENRGNAPLGVEGRFEFLRPGEKEPIAVASFPRGTLLPEPVATGIFTATLPTPDLLPSGRYIVRAVIDIGLDHYLGVERPLELTRAAAPTKVP